MVELNIMVRVRWTAYCQGFSEPNTGPQWCQYEISDCGLRIADCGLRISDCKKTLLNFMLLPLEGL